MNKNFSRDPSGFIFKHNGVIYRAINYSYQKDYEHLIQSGLYEKVVSEDLLIRHTETALENSFDTGNAFDSCYKIIKPVEVEFLSYPYEWSFEQLKDAAITTLLLQKHALDYNMSLKDASAYNIQFLDCKPILIDTLSFEIYKEGSPWIAYKQFCQHFLAPLLLMKYKDVRFHRVTGGFTDGVPLDLANSLLPLRCKLNLKIFLHISLHSKAQKRFTNKKIDLQKNRFPKKAFYGLVEHLMSLVKNLELGYTKSKKLSDKNSHWLKYYEEGILNTDYLNRKIRLITNILEKEKFLTLWDLGSNIGMISKIAVEKNIRVVCFDLDPLVINEIYLDCKTRGESNVLPLIMDLVNPSSSSGWMLSERSSFMERTLPDMVMALALIHHLAIANNIPLASLAEFFSKISKKLLIEFVPKNDPNVKLLLRNREDIFTQYDQINFEKEFEKYFRILSCEQIETSDPKSSAGRVLYLMEIKLSAQQGHTTQVCAGT
ncbi:MAG: SAM-dependent methyltransferase [Bacteroidota bacterium]